MKERHGGVGGVCDDPLGPSSIHPAAAAAAVSSVMRRRLTSPTDAENESPTDPLAHVCFVFLCRMTHIDLADSCLLAHIL